MKTRSKKFASNATLEVAKEDEMKTQDTNLKRGDVTAVATRKGTVDCAVVSSRYISKGRNAGELEYKLAPLTGKKGSTFGWTCIGSRHLRPASKKWNAKKIAEAIAAYEGTKVEVDDRREVKKEKRQEKLAKMSPRVGDEVLIRYRDFPDWRRVAAVNERTGKVGIAAAGYEAKKNAKDHLRGIAYIVGDEEMMNRIRDPRRYRWIDPRHIMKIRRIEKDGTVNEQTL